MTKKIPLHLTGETEKLLNEFIAKTGYNRNKAINILIQQRTKEFYYINQERAKVVEKAKRLGMKKTDFENLEF